MTEKTIIRVQIKEGIVKSTVRLVRGVILYTSVIGIGIWVDSQAMQWAGFLALVLGILAYAMVKNDETMTIAEARKELDRLEAREQ